MRSLSILSGRSVGKEDFEEESDEISLRAPNDPIKLLWKENTYIDRYVNRTRFGFFFLFFLFFHIGVCFSPFSYFILDLKLNLALLLTELVGLLTLKDTKFGAHLHYNLKS